MAIKQFPACTIECIPITGMYSVYPKYAIEQNLSVSGVNLKREKSTEKCFELYIEHKKLQVQLSCKFTLVMATAEV